MKRIVTILGILALLSGAMESQAQQLMQMSSYLMNDYVINPAFAGSRDYFDVKAMNRHQWSGIQDAPRTFTLALNGPFQNGKVGMGGYIFTDNVGPTRRTGAQISYAYHFQLNEKLRLGLGLSAGALQFSIDGSKIDMAEDGDPALYGELRSKVVFDAKFGTVLYSDDFYVGITIPQMLQSNVNLFDSNDPSLNRLEDHYMLLAGYRIRVSDSFMVEPSALIKYVDPSPVKYDLSTRVMYNDVFWVGGSYRNNDAWVMMAGFEYRRALSVSYAYDLTTSDLGNYSYGTHELVVGFRFDQ